MMFSQDTIRDAVEDSITWPVRKVIPILPGDYRYVNTQRSIVEHLIRQILCCQHVVLISHSCWREMLCASKMMRKNGSFATCYHA